MLERHTLSGSLRDTTEFSLSYKVDGTFAVIGVSCHPVKCRVPSQEQAVSSVLGDVVHGTTATYTCLDGYVSRAAVVSYSGTCSADGSFEREASAGICKAAVCGFHHHSRTRIFK